MNLKKFIDQPEYKNDYNYFAANILLLSDLCLDRNKIAIDKLSDVYTFTICSKIINTDSFGHKL